MAIISRGFSGRRSAAGAKLPPGQYLTTDFPVLSAGPTPQIALDRWEFTIDDGSNVLKRWDWKSFRELPSETITTDLHCVTRWSKLGTSWEGVSLDVLAGRSKDGFALRHVPFVWRLHDEPPPERCHQQGLDCVQIRRCRPRARTRWPRAASGSSSLSVEERQMGEGH